MAPERIFQGRQRGILGLEGNKDTCTPRLAKAATRALQPQLHEAPAATFHAPQARPTHNPKPRPRSLQICPLLQPRTIGEPSRPPAPSAPRDASWASGRLERTHCSPKTYAWRPCCGSRRGPGAGIRTLAGRVPVARGAASLTAAGRGCLARSALTSQPGSPGSALRPRCALGGGADALAARAPARSLWVGPRWRRQLCQECESFRFPLGIKANHK